MTSSKQKIRKFFLQKSDKYKFLKLIRFIDREPYNFIEYDTEPQ